MLTLKAINLRISGLAGFRQGSTTNNCPGVIMNVTRKIWVRISERRGQAMTEYALILSAVAVVAFLVYQSLGNNIGNLLTNVISDL